MRTRRRNTFSDDRRRNGPVMIVKPNPGLWREALQLAGGDPTRCRVQPDGSVIVVNDHIELAASLRRAYRAGYEDGRNEGGSS